MSIVKPPLKVVRELFPSSKGYKFSFAFIYGADYVPGEKVRFKLIAPGGDEVAEKCSLEQCVDRGFFGGKLENAYGMFQQTAVWPLVIGIVQSTFASDFNSGEIPYILDMANEKFNIVDYSFEGISLGGRGGINWFNSKERITPFRKMVFNMPWRGSGVNEAAFVSAAVAAGVETLFLHAADDNIADPTLSINLDAAIKKAGGKSTLVLWKTGGHGCITRSWNVWGDTKIEGSYNSGIMWNTTKFAVDPRSDKPMWVVPEWLFMQVVPDDKLIYTQQIWQRADGSCYGKPVINL